VYAVLLPFYMIPGKFDRHKVIERP